MIPCRLKIITANINSDEQISDTEVIKYVSQCINPLKSSEADFLKQSSQQQPEEEEKNMEKQNEEEDEDIIIIYDKNDLVKKRE